MYNNKKTQNRDFMEYLIREIDKDVNFRLKTIIGLRYDKESHFADKLGKSRQSVNHTLKGVYTISMPKLIEWCKALNIKPMDVLDFKRYIELLKNEKNKKNVNITVDK